MSAWRPRDQTRYLSRSPGWILVHPRVSPFLIIGFLVLVGFVGYLCCFQRLLNPIQESNYLSKKSSVVVEVTHLLSGIWFVQIPFQLLSRYFQLAVYRKGWLRYILFDRTSFLSVEPVVYRPNTPCFDVSSTFSDGTMQDAVLPNQFCSDLCVPCSLDPQTWRIPSVFCSNFDLLVSMLNLWWSVTWWHIQCDKCTRRDRSELKHCPAVRDQ